MGNKEEKKKSNIKETCSVTIAIKSIQTGNLSLKQSDREWKL